MNCDDGTSHGRSRTDVGCRSPSSSPPRSSSRSGSACRRRTGGSRLRRRGLSALRRGARPHLLSTPLRARPDADRLAIRATRDRDPCCCPRLRWQRCVRLPVGRARCRDGGHGAGKAALLRRRGSTPSGLRRRHGHRRCCRPAAASTSLMGTSTGWARSASDVRSRTGRPALRYRPSWARRWSVRIVNAPGGAGMASKESSRRSSCSRRVGSAAA